MHVTSEIAKGNNLSSLDPLLIVEDIYNSQDIRMYFTTNYDNSWNGTAYERYGASFDVQPYLVTIQNAITYNGQQLI